MYAWQAWTLTLQDQRAAQRCTSPRDSTDVVNLVLPLEAEFLSALMGKDLLPEHSSPIYPSRRSKSALALVRWHKYPRNPIPGKRLLCLLSALLIFLASVCLLYNERYWSGQEYSCNMIQRVSIRPDGFNRLRKDPLWHWKLIIHGCIW